MITTLITADTHFTDDPRDAHRMDLLDWLIAQANKRDAYQVLFLGDLTQNKDRHSATLVNVLADKLVQLAKVADVIILRGNHDAVDEDWPFFRFMRWCENVRFIVKPTTIKHLPGLGRCLFLPATKNAEDEWSEFDFLPCDYIFCHQTFEKAIAENGIRLEGVPPTIFGKTQARVISGDIHVPQKIGKQIEYVGAPYHVRFGDTFNPRVLLVYENGKQESLSFNTKKKEVVEVRGIEGLRTAIKSKVLRSGDQVKIRVKLKRADFATWPELRREVRALAEKQGWDVCALEMRRMEERAKERVDEVDVASVDPVAIVRDHAKKQKLTDDVTRVGIELVGGGLRDA